MSRICPSRTYVTMTGGGALSVRKQLKRANTDMEISWGRQRAQVPVPDLPTKSLFSSVSTLHAVICIR